MAQSKYVVERRKAIEELKDNFAILADKKMAWKDLHRLTSDNNSELRWRAANALGSAFSHISDKKMAWNDLNRLTSDTDRIVRRGAADALGNAFIHFIDKKQAWGNLMYLTKDKDSSVRYGAASALGIAFSNIPDKEQSWNDIHRLIQNKDLNVRAGAASALGTAFYHIPDKEQGWNDLHRLTQDNDDKIRYEAASALGKAFTHIPDKKQAWADLHRLTQDIATNNRWVTVKSLVMAFSYLPDKKQAWVDLHRLTQDNDDSVRRDAAYALGSVFSQVPDKKQAWEDLIRLTSDTDSDVRGHVASALGSAFSHVPDKKQAWNNLHGLTSDTDSNVRASAYNSMGKASIFKASNVDNKEDFKKEMEEAIMYFEKSSQEEGWSEQAKFSLPFYRSFYTLIFKKDEAEAEVKKSLVEAKRVVEGSSNKKKLSEALENLGNALKEVQKAPDFNDVKCDLNAYRLYCDRAVDMLDKAEDKTPGSLRLIRKGLPIIDERIKDILGEIQEKAKCALEGPESKERLLEAIENLSIALSEEQKSWDINDVKFDLNACRKYYERAVEMLDEADEKNRNSNSFRLSSLKINDKLFNGEEIRLCKDNSSTLDNYYSLIIGNNGSGKSRILSSIARHFQDKIKYRISGQQLLFDEDNFNSTQLPEKIITISSSINDKFPMDETYRTFDQFDIDYRNLDYIYLGTRNRANNYSTKALLNRAISIMYESYVDESVAANYRHIFDYLKYEPIIKIEYKMALSNIKDKNGEITKSSLLEYFKSPLYIERYGIYVDKFIKYENESLAEIISLLNEISHKNTYDIFIDFSEEGIQKISTNPDTYKNDYKIFKLLLTLQKLRVVRNSEIKVSKNGGEFSFTEASSGEANVLSTLIALIPLVKNNSLILIDEPEISLHPFWQQKYIDLLKNIFSHVKGCHIIIASHSPFLASDLPQNCSSVVSLIENKGKIVCKLIEESTFGWSTENILLNVFKVPFVRNYYLSQLLSEALELLGKYDRDENRLNEIKVKLRDLNPNIKSEDPLKKVIELILNM